MRHSVRHTVPHGQGRERLGVTLPLSSGTRRLAVQALLVLTLVLRLGALFGNVGYGIPRVVDADEQEQNRSRTAADECRCRIAREQKRRADECCVGGERKYHMP